MNKNIALKRRGLEADLAMVESKILQHLKHRANAERNLARLKFSETTSSTWARHGGEFPSHGFNL